MLLKPCLFSSKETYFRILQESLYSLRNQKTLNLTNDQGYFYAYCCYCQKEIIFWIRNTLITLHCPVLPRGSALHPLPFNILGACAIFWENNSGSLGICSWEGGGPRILDADWEVTGGPFTTLTHKSMNETGFTFLFGVTFGSW